MRLERRNIHGKSKDVCGNGYQERPGPQASPQRRTEIQPGHMRAEVTTQEEEKVYVIVGSHCHNNKHTLWVKH